MKVLVADDAILFRRVLADLLASLPGVQVVGTAVNGRIALQKVRELRPDLMTLDIEMPDMDGLAVLDELRRTQEKLDVIVVSALSRRGGDLTMRALEKGAFDFITKSEGTDARQSRDLLLRELEPRIRAAAHRLEIRGILRSGSAPLPARVGHRPASRPPSAPVIYQRDEQKSLVAKPGLETVAGRMHRLTAAPGVAEMVLIGVSTGGPAALAKLLPALPGGLGVPVLVVQHMPPVFTQSLADSLAPRCALRVKEAAHGELAEANTVYLAPGGRQMRVASGSGGQIVLQITDDPPENNCRPAVDYLFRSVASHFPGRAMAAILTGMGSDGAVGVRLLKRHGCFVVAQDEATCVVYGMPKAVVDAGAADVVLPLDSIAAKIAAVVKSAKA